MDLHIFVKQSCSQCPTAKDLGKKLEEQGRVVHYQSLDTAEGMAQALKYGIRSLPTILLMNNGKEEGRWVYPELLSEKEALSLF